eukprot:XP_001704234.1 Hypothetical protein GL50803_9034 [Giardia lamblia ATCC 50803]
MSSSNVIFILKTTHNSLPSADALDSPPCPAAWCSLGRASCN